jgi:hypothetical protein
MDAAYLHLLANHVPIILCVVGTLAALLALVVQKRGVWVYAAASITLAAILVYPVMLAGEQAEVIVERRWYASRDAIRAHEEAAELATWVTLGAGVIAAYAWFRAARPRHREDRFPSSLQVLLTLAGLAASGTLGYASWQSGYVVHKAVAPPGTVPGVEAQPVGPPAGQAPAPGSPTP